MNRHTLTFAVACLIGSADCTSSPSTVVGADAAASGQDVIGVDTGVGLDAAPTDSAPTDSAPTDSAPTDGAPMDSVSSDAALDGGALDARADSPTCGLEVGALSDAALGGASAGSRQIEAVIRAPVGPANLPLTGVTVTYVKPPDTGDVAGFMVQAEQAGPALFIPTSALAAPVAVAVGDVVNLRVTEKIFSNGPARASVVEDFVVASRGASVEALRQDLSGANDVVGRVPLYESELVHVEGVISSAWEPASREHHFRARLATAGVPTSDPTSCGLWVRLPVPLFNVTGYRVGCRIRLNGVLWRFNTDAQFTSYVPGEVSITCP